MKGIRDGFSASYSINISLEGMFSRNEKMTCLIHAKNRDKILIASDSWNKFNGEPNRAKHLIKKICVNKKYPLIIASAGENGIKYFNGRTYYIYDMMNDFCNEYNGQNFNDCFNKLTNKTSQILNDLLFLSKEDNIQNGYPAHKVVQYFISYYDINTHNIISEVYEFIRYKNSQTFLNENVKKMNVFFSSFGTYAQDINYKYANVNIDSYPNSLLEKEVFKVIDNFIQNEKYKFIDDISIGGPIQWAIIYNNGKLKTNLDNFNTY